MRSLTSRSHYPPNDDDFSKVPLVRLCVIYAWGNEASSLVAIAAVIFGISKDEERESFGLTQTRRNITIDALMHAKHEKCPKAKHLPTPK